jgi:hypothetical protein
MTFMRPVKGFVFLIWLVVCSGCALLHHKDQLILMGELARDKNVQGALVDSIDAKYDALVVVINSGKLKNYPDQTAILNNFGQPIARKIVNLNGQDVDRWLYRHAIGQKAKDKVYLYFDTQGKLITYTQENIEWK